jgi:hypothetical protein
MSEPQSPDRDNPRSPAASRDEATARELEDIEEALDLLREEAAKRADLVLLSAVDLCERLLRLLGVPAAWSSQPRERDQGTLRSEGRPGRGGPSRGGPDPGFHRVSRKPGHAP